MNLPKKEDIEQMDALSTERRATLISMLDLKSEAGLNNYMMSPNNAPNNECGFMEVNIVHADLDIALYEKSQGRYTASVPKTGDIEVVFNVYPEYFPKEFNGGREVFPEDVKEFLEAEYDGSTIGEILSSNFITDILIEADFEVNVDGDPRIANEVFDGDENWPKWNEKASFLDMQSGLEYSMDQEDSPAPP